MQIWIERLPDAMLREAVAKRLATVEKRSDIGIRPHLFVEVSSENTKVGLPFSSLHSKLTDSEITLYNGVSDLYLRRADWPQ